MAEYSDIRISDTPHPTRVGPFKRRSHPDGSLFSQNRLGVFPGLLAVKIQVGLFASSKDHLQTDWRTLPDISGVIPDNSQHIPKVEASWFVFV